MTEHDRVVGRWLLQRGLCSVDALQQAGATTLARRQAGEQVELLVVLVQLGALSKDVARQAWAELGPSPPLAASSLASPALYASPTQLAPPPPAVALPPLAAPSPVPLIASSPSIEESATEAPRKRPPSGRPKLTSARVARPQPGAKRGGPPLPLMGAAVLIIATVILARRPPPSAPRPTSSPSSTTSPSTGADDDASAGARPSSMKTWRGGPDGAPPLPGDTPLSRAELEELSLQWAYHLLIPAWELRKAEEYDEAIRRLETFPPALRAGSGHAQVQEELGELARLRTFSRRLRSALEGGPASEDLRGLIRRIEGGRLEADLAALPAIERFKEDARRLLGPDAYDQLAVESMELPDVVPADDE